MDEVEWWEFDSPAEMAEQAAGDIAFVIESAVEAHKGARLALPGGTTPEVIYGTLVKKEVDWTRVTIVPTDERLVPQGHEASIHRRLQGFFGARGAEIVPLVEEAALGDREEAGRRADARLSLLQWPLDLVCLGMGADGHTASIFPGPDFDRALSGPRERRAVGVLPQPMPETAPFERVTLTAAALTSARAIMIVLRGAEKRRVLEQAIKEGPLSSLPIGRVISAIETPIDIFWTA